MDRPGHPTRGPEAYDAGRLSPYRSALDAHSGWRRGPRAPKVEPTVD